LEGFDMTDGIPNRDGIISETGERQTLIAADRLTSEKVVNEEGEHLGEVKHLMINVLDGRINYAVLSYGGVFGLGDKLFAVPWQALAIDIDNKRFVLNVSKDKLKGAPGFDKDHWPAMADPKWAGHVDGYYGPPAAHRTPFI
jgi:sporulation protein YlmC with PRC-barrel domain